MTLCSHRSFSTNGVPRTDGFSLVEVTLALGIAVFGLVAIIGVLPTALSTDRRSFDLNRASAVADTLFGSFRGQPFQSVCYLDAQFDSYGHPLSSPAASPLDPDPPRPLDLNAASTSTGVVTFYATFLEGSAPDNATGSYALGDQRHVRFASEAGAGTAYLIQMRFNNEPTGTVVSPQPNASNQPPIVPAEANQIEMIISPVNRPADQYHFMSTVANRTN